MKRSTASGIILLFFLLTAGCAGAAAGPRGTASGSASSAELEALREARMDSLRGRFSEADVRFASAMIAHHAQALEMSRHAAANGASGPVRTLAARIISGQADEIAILQQWLRDRGQPVPEPALAGMHMDHGTDHSAEMPGMLSR